MDFIEFTSYNFLTYNKNQQIRIQYSNIVALFSYYEHVDPRRLLYYLDLSA